MVVTQEFPSICVDLCRAIAVALFDDPTKVEFCHLASQEGKSICIPINRTNKVNLTEQMRKHNIAYASVLFENANALYRTYEAQGCDFVVIQS